MLYGDCNVKSLFGSKDVSIIKVILFDRLFNVYTHLTFEHADFVACVREQDHKQNYAAEGAHSGGQHICAFVNAQAKNLPKPVLLKQLLAKLATLPFLFFSHISLFK